MDCLSASPTLNGGFRVERLTVPGRLPPFKLARHSGAAVARIAAISGGGGPSFSSTSNSEAGPRYHFPVPQPRVPDYPLQCGMVGHEPPMARDELNTNRIPELARCDDATIRRDVLSRVKPVVLRGLVGHWPAVRHGRTSPQAIIDYLRRLDNGNLVNAILIPPGAGGRLGYNAAMSGFNFARNRVTLASVGEQILRYSAFAHGPAVAAQAARIDECLPGFVDENPLTLLDPSVRPRLWLGNTITTPAHVDETHNIACASLRAQQLPEPHRSDMRALLREYVDVRVNAALGQEPLPRALVRSDELQDELWARAVTLGQESPAIPSAAAFGQALIQMFEVDSKRVAAGLHNSIPSTIWLALYCLAALALAIAGYRAGLAGRRPHCNRSIGAGVCRSVPPDRRSRSAGRRLPDGQPANADRSSDELAPKVTTLA